MRGRDLVWDGCANVRDLGGHPTADGSETRWRSIVRADSVRQLSDEGWAALVDYGVRTIVDLRWRSELEADPPAELPVEVVHISLAGETPERPDPPLPTTRDFYGYVLDRYAANFARVVEMIARAPEGGVVVHCAAGKDRTGLVVALLLRLAGVPAEEIALDYSLSAKNLAPTLDAWVAEAPDEEERESRRRMSASEPETMLGVIEDLERRYGSADEYLVAAGVDEADLERVRARLRATPSSEDR